MELTYRMAVASNKARIMLSLEKEFIKHIKEKAKINNRTLSEEVTITFKKLEELEEKMSSEE